jgi:hypothetical protein
VADSYDKLTTDEKCYWNLYTRLRQLSDWSGFTDGQDQARAESRDWLVNQRKQIWRAAQPKSEGGDGNGWGVNNRQARYDMLKDESLNTGSPHDICQLPTNGGTPTEKVKIAERMMWWNQSSVDAATKDWRQSNADWLTARRKQVWHLINDPDGDASADRPLRYDNLCIATKTGDAYDQWSASHDDRTGASNPTSNATSARAQAVSNCRKYLGVTEKPPDSNRGSPQPDGWENRVYGSSGVPWCACFATCMAWDAGVKGSSSAAVQYIMSMAQSAQGMFRGWTTDPSDVLRGDLAVISCSTCHVGMVVDSDDVCHTIEGNTSPGSEGSQFNGGCVAEKHRPRADIVGWALVDYPS